MFDPLSAVPSVLPGAAHMAELHAEVSTDYLEWSGETVLCWKIEYREPGNYSVVVKVIDILGNDTTKAIEVEVK